MVTPPLSDTILPGITRDTLLALAGELGILTRIARQSVELGAWAGVSEVFSSGTAAGVTWVREVRHRGRLLFEAERPGPIGDRLGDALRDVQQGRRPDPRGWRHVCAAKPWSHAQRRVAGVGGS